VAVLSSSFIYVVTFDGAPTLSAELIVNDSRVAPYRRAYKIGMSRNPQSRLSTLQTAHPRTVFPSVLISVVEGEVSSREAALHRRFNDWKIHGEWFWLSDEDVDDLVAMMSAYDRDVLLFIQQWLCDLPGVDDRANWWREDDEDADEDVDDEDEDAA
jgi:hypothetical protein